MLLLLSLPGILEIGLVPSWLLRAVWFCALSDSFDIFEAILGKTLQRLGNTVESEEMAFPFSYFPRFPS